MIDVEVLQRLDHSARRVLWAAQGEAARYGDRAIGTEHLLLALASVDGTTTRLLANAGVALADLRRIRDSRERRFQSDPDYQTLLTTLGINLDEVRSRAVETFGAPAIVDAVSRVRPRRPRRPLWTWISCSKPLPQPIGYRLLTGPRPEPIPRVTRLVRRAARAARPHPASPPHLLLALLSGKEPACEVLAEHGADLDEIDRATRHQLKTDAAARRAVERTRR